MEGRKWKQLFCLFGMYEEVGSVRTYGAESGDLRLKEWIYIGKGMDLRKKTYKRGPFHISGGLRWEQTRS